MIWKNLTRITSLLVVTWFLLKGMKMIIDSLGFVVGSILLSYFFVIVYVEYLLHGIIGGFSALVAVVLVTALMWVLGFFNDDGIKLDTAGHSKRRR